MEKQRFFFIEVEDYKVGNPRDLLCHADLERLGGFIEMQFIFVNR